MRLSEPAERYAYIRETANTPANVLTIKDMCEISGVSRSGYYRWLNTEEDREKRENQDRRDFILIKNAYAYRGYKKGARSIYMRLLHQDPPVVMNVKKIRRLMRKYNLKCPVRKANPYKRMAKALKESTVAPNLVNRRFTELGPRMVLLTDITYLPYSHSCAYLSTIIDAYTRQVLAYALSPSLEIDFVLETVQNLVRDHGVALSKETYIHSDQGSHYTSKKFIQIIKDAELRQSMSRKGNCWDNAPQESFFGHMKDEIGSFLHVKQYDQVKAIIDDWIDYYNNDRYDWQLSKLSPNEYYEYVTTGNYPLAIKNI
jgi:transposase InsO family protein